MSAATRQHLMVCPKANGDAALSGNDICAVPVDIGPAALDDLSQGGHGLFRKDRGSVEGQGTTHREAVIVGEQTGDLSPAADSHAGTMCGELPIAIMGKLKAELSLGAGWRR